jgi:subtilisin family serine protease
MKSLTVRCSVEPDTVKMRRRHASLALALALAVAVAVSATPLPSFAASDAAPPPPKAAATAPPEAEALGLIVRYAPGIGPTVNGEVSGSSDVSVELTAGDDLGRGLRTVEFDEILGADEAQVAAEELAESPLVLAAYPDFVYRQSAIIQTVDSEPVPPSVVTTQTSTTWALGRVDQTSPSLDYRYIYDTTGEGVTAYIVDTGIRTTHTHNSRAASRRAITCRGSQTRTIATVTARTSLAPLAAPPTGSRRK